MISYGIQGLAVITGLSFASVLLWRYPVRAALVVLGITIGLDALQPEIYLIDVGLLVNPDDMASLVLLAAGVLVALRSRKLSISLSWPLFILLALVALNVIRGASEFGIRPAGNGVRVLAHFIVPAIGFVLLRPALVLTPQRIAKWILWIGFGFVILAAARWIGVLPTPHVVTGDDFREVVRVIPADEAMIVAQALIAILFLQVTFGIRWWGVVLAAFLGLTTIALQHRSVWSSLLVGLTWLVIRTFRRYPRLWLQLAAGALVGVTITAATLAATSRVDSVASLVTSNIDETQHQDSSWNWRLQGFTEATDRALSGDMFDTLVGPPSGRDLESTASTASVHIHSRYVDTLAYYGLLGLASLIAFLSIVAKKVGGWVRFTQEHCERWAGRVFLQALLLSQLIYFIAYTGEPLQGVILAMILLTSEYGPVAVSTSREVRQAARPRSRVPAVR